MGDHGFVYNGSTYTSLNVPGATAGTTDAYSINDSGQVAGIYKDANGTHGFVYNGGSYTTINDPNATNGTYLLGIGNNGEVVGYYRDGIGYGYHGFTEIGGVYTALEAPGAQTTYGTTITANGKIAGWYYDGTKDVGFVNSGGTYTSYVEPNATNGPASLNNVNATTVSGINSSGELAGYYYDAAGSHGFIYNGGYTTFDVAGAIAATTYITGLNQSSQLTGIYSDTAGHYIGFIATPAAVPLPGTAWLFGTVLVGVTGFSRRKLIA
ncbi:hypothetical protein KEF85_06875 [Methylomonas paludis]|uniref:Uncharacterized protein n=1 Tax=Methylomonas paludis TaxID=1173101 RepID=A0A975RAH8_9GAMM|nr:hypothetical protein [Methylomonas paludis]QWF72167.1 hypothetical protein KEF85_06875 [Methylomonas paludis]